MAYWYQFALLFEALFILTTIDAGTRVARYLVQEMAGRAYAPFRQLNWWPGFIGASLLVVGAWGYLLGAGSISTIWPMFGAANQLLGTLALCVGTTVLIKMGKARYLWVTAVPMLCVGTITLTGSYELFVWFMANAGAALPGDAFTFYLDAALVGIVALLAVIVLVDSIRQWYGYLVQGQPFTTTETPMTVAEGANFPSGRCC
jgi:carbon starvation protein